MIGEYNSSNAIQRRYVHGPGTDEPIVWYEGADLADRRWLTADERGSIVAVTNSGGGAMGINLYDEYGIPASTNYGRFGYTGQTWLPELGMYYYKARIYSPTLGRFMQTDPIGYADGMNWYNYVGSDPINGTDPTGKCRFTVWAHFEQRWDDAKGAYGPKVFVGTSVEQDSPCGDAAIEAALSNGAQQISTLLASNVCSIGPSRPASGTPHGSTIGSNPRFNGGRYLTQASGGIDNAVSMFMALVSFSNDATWRTGGLLDRPGTILITGPNGNLRLRLGVDYGTGVPGRPSIGFSPRIDIRANVLSLSKPETIHFDGKEAVQCPTPT